MKKLLLLLIIINFNLSSAQSSDLDAFTALRENSILLYKNFSQENCRTTYESYSGVKPLYALYVKSVFKCKSPIDDQEKNVVETYINGNLGYFDMEYPDKKSILFNDKAKSFNEFKKSFDSLSPADKNRLDSISKTKSINFKVGSDAVLEDKFYAYQKYGIAIIEAHPTENYSMTGADFKILNFSKKTIKYITFTFYGTNAVKDKVLGGNKSYTISRKGIGPVKYLSTAEWSYDTVWLTDIVQTLELVSVKIEYMDKTFKTILIQNKHYMDQDLLDDYDASLQTEN